MKVYIIGIGLIGGSLALTLRNNLKSVRIFGIDKSEDHKKKALELGVIDVAAEMEEVRDADLVIIAVPVDAASKVVGEVLDLISDSTIVMDMGSTKENLCKSLEDHPRRRNFLATHPIAGNEFSGPEAAIPDLFQGKTTIICEVEKTALPLQEKALAILQQLGMRIRYMNPKAHDKHIAYVSHLSHISSYMLGKTVMEKEQDERDIFDLAGSGFASTVRLAKSSASMWAPIFQLNRENVLESLREYIHNLTEFQKLMEQEDFGQVFEEIQKTNHIKTILNGKI